MGERGYAAATTQEIASRAGVSEVTLFRRYGGAVMTLIVDVPRHPEPGEALSALRPDLRNAAGVIAAHQARGRSAPGDPLQKPILLIGPVIAAGPWARGGNQVPVVAPADLVEAFLHGHADRRNPR